MFVLLFFFRSDCIWFFFFKQKTAYEMRISDWSSDVCSSDLRVALERAVAIGEFALAGSEPPDLRGGAFEHFDRVDALAHLHAVGADVLDRRGADGAGDQGEVFQPAQPQRQRVHDEAVPRQARAGAPQPGGAIALARFHE